MLRKFLTTIVVLAATTAAWADGWKVTSVENGGDASSVDGKSKINISVIEWIESGDKATLAEAIAVANDADSYMIRIIGDITGQDDALSSIKKEKVDLSKVTGMTKFGVFAENTAVKYVILPDNTPKADVDALGKTVDAAASKKAHTETVWKYNRNGVQTVYNGGRYEQGDVVKGKVSEEATLNNETKLYDGIVFYDKSGNAYQTSNNSKSVQLTAYKERYTYEDENGATRLYPNDSDCYVVSENGGYVGVQTSSTVTVEKKDVEYIYEKDDKTYAYSFREYGKWDNYIGKKGEQFYMLENGSFVDIQTETKWMIDGTSDVYNEENGRLVTNNNIGHVDGTKIPLTKVSAYYVPNTNNIYEGPIRIDGEKAYGRDGGTPVELSLVYYYNDGTEKEADNTFCVSYDNTKVAKKADLLKVTIDPSCNGVKEENGTQHWNISENSLYKGIGDGEFYYHWYFTNYPVTRLGYEYPDGTTCTEVYTKDGKYYGYTDGAEIELENRISYTTVGGETYEGDVYTYNNEYFGYNDGTSVELKEETSEYYTQYGVTHPVTKENYKSEDGKKVYVGGTQTPLTLYNKEAYVITTTGELHTGRVCDETTGLIGGTVTDPVTYSAEGYYYNTDNTDNTDYVYTGEYLTKPANEYNTTIYGCTDNNVLSPLEAVYKYTYTDPITGETVDYKTMEQESSVTVTHEVELTSSEESAGNVHLTAYVSKPGSLLYTLSRWSDLGDGTNHNNGYGYALTSVTALTLSGDVNYADIGNMGNTISEYGHAEYWDSGTKTNIVPAEQGHTDNIISNKPAMNSNALTYLDLTDAVFAVQTDMQFAKVNLNLKIVKLPTHESMTLIPDNAFKNLQHVSELCIPYNYTTIGSGAFYNTHALMHIYTTDDPADDSDDETTVDHGPYTFTFSANLEQIEGGDVAESGTSSTFFGKDIEQVTDVYVLATKAPKCGATAFAGPMTYGNNGFKGNWAHPISRENYNNSKRWMCVLHFPSECADNGEDKNYTDITRNYTLADETGAVDGRGKALLWPRHAEFYRAYNQAINGHIWYDWKEYAEGSNEVIQSIGAGIVSADPEGYNKEYYQGWHEFVLTGNSRSREFDAQAENTEFIQRDWYTLCVPYDMTKSHFLEVFGVDPTKSTSNKVTMLDGTIEENISKAMYPDVRVVTHISRSVNSGKMTIHLSKPLINDTENTNWQVVIPENGQGYEYQELAGDDPIIIKGGHPFLVRGYVPAAWNDQIKNLGMYIMAIAETDNATAMADGASEEELPYKYNKDCLVNGVSLPCVDHHIHALNADQTVGENKVYVYEDAAQQTPACYHFIGTYTATTVPQYAYYLGKNKNTAKHQFFRTTKETTKWNPYSAVIIGLNNPEYNNNDFAQGSSSALKNIIVRWNTPKSDLVILEGEDPARAGQALTLKFDEDAFSGEATGITDINSKVNVSNNKVYSINGQYMGTSLNNLPKGIYIINGQKKVVK